MKTLKRRTMMALTGLLPATAGRVEAQGGAMRTIGLLAIEAPGHDQFDSLMRQDMAELGYVEGRDVRYLFRASARPDGLDALAAELVESKADVIVTWYTPAALAAKRTTRTIPIVMALAGNPVETGIVSSLAKPGGNITGLSGTSAELGRKCMELAHEILPGARQVAALANGKDPFSGPFLQMARDGGDVTGLSILPVVIMDAETLPDAIAEAKRMGAQALLVQPSLPRRRIAELALAAGLPAFSVANGFNRDGGLLSYAAHEPDIYRRAAAMIDKVLKGTPPSDIPIELPTRYALQINLRTARALGVAVPETLLVRADDLIE